MSACEIDDILEKLRGKNGAHGSEGAGKPKQHNYSNEILQKYGLTDLIV